VSSTNGSAPRIAAVLPGGGARGAYEAGAMSVLLPALAARGEHISVYCGTSVGAINAAALASFAHLPADEQGEAHLARWRAMRKGSVISPILGPGSLLMLLRLAGAALGVPGARVASFMDPAPLRGSLDAWIDWEGLRSNVSRGTVEAVCVVATALARGGPVAFVNTRRPLPRGLSEDELRYVRATLSHEHIRASAAIPFLFPPVEVTSPRAARDHYIDGGTRLNSPIKPALALGADRVIVVGFEPFALRARPPAPPTAPHLSDVAANVLDGLLVDQVADDLQRLAAINSFFADGSISGSSRAARAYRASRGRSSYRKVAYAIVAPERHGEIATIAERVFERRYGGLRGLRSPDYPLLSRLLGGHARSRGELLSFLFFDEVFVEELIQAGRRDAERWIERHPRVWCSDAAHDFDVDVLHAANLREAETLVEFRELRRR